MSVASMEPMAPAAPHDASADARLAQRARRDAGSLQRLLRLYMELTKARLSALVLLTTAAGFVLASDRAIDWPMLAWTIVGSGLAAGAASALNQLIEMPRDARMHRTRSRPLPSGAMSPRHALIAATVMAAVGVVILNVFTNALASGLALLTILIYVLAYTPLKVRSTLNTLVGAVCGALPPMIGWAAAAGELAPGAWILAAVLFLWQIPHFLALAWLYRDDYARGGFRMLPIVDARGQLTCQVVVLSSLALLPISLTAIIAGVAGWIYASGALVLGLWMTWLAIRLYHDRSPVGARRLFLASLLYLSLLLPLMVIDRGPAGGSLEAAAMAGVSADVELATRPATANP